MNKNEPIKHAKVTTTTEAPDGSKTIESNSYYEQLAHTETEIEKKTIVPMQGVLKELIDSTEQLQAGAGRVVLTLKRTGGGYVEVTRRWLVAKESFNRK